MGERRAVTTKMAASYRRGTRGQKSAILDQLVELTGWHRDHARARLRAAGQIRVVQARAPRAPTYGPEVLSALERCWLVARQPAGKRLAPMLSVLVPLLVAEGELELSEPEVTLLCQMSPATIDRRLRGARVLAELRGVSHTKPGSLLKTQISIRTWSEWDGAVPGFCEIDLVGHEGGTPKGEFCCTLTVTDVATGWTVNRAVKNKAAVWVKDAIDHVRRVLPFPLLGIDSDNGSEFISHHLLAYCEQHKITFTRGREGNKNDGCHVEQKNWTHVRELVGYLRYDTGAELSLLNRIYEVDRTYTNLVLTQQKLVFKERVGAKVTLRHDAAQSPYERLVAADVLSSARRAALTRQRNSLKPAALQRQIRALCHELQTLSLTKAPAPPARSTGPSTSPVRRRVLREATTRHSRRV